jgi:signal transduction histidine kinase
MDIMKDSLLNLERSEALEELELKYRTVVKDKQLQEQERMVAETSLLAERRNRYIIILISALIILALFGLFYFQHTKRKAQAERDAAIIVEREMGIRAVLLATEEERKRIAKDLHDGVVQGLTGLKLRIAKPTAQTIRLAHRTRSRIQRNGLYVRRVHRRVRTISHRMMPRALSELGLVPAMADLLDKTLGQANIQFQFEHHKVEGIRFDETVEVSLYRIAQELITNIIKHAQAQAVSVQLLKTASHLVLVVEDNGKGFAYEDQTNRNGIGLMNISSRAKALHGEVTYVPSPLQGTVATIRIPLA